jgi:hypothetical protein
MTARTYFVTVRGFEFPGVHVRASTRGRARFLAAQGYEDAGFGSIVDALTKVITGVRLDPSADGRPLISGAIDEGLVAVLGTA